MKRNQANGKDKRPIRNFECPEVEWQALVKAAGRLNVSVSAILRDLTVAAVTYIKERCPDNRWHPPVLCRPEFKALALHEFHRLGVDVDGLMGLSVRTPVAPEPNHRKRGGKVA